MEKLKRFLPLHLTIMLFSLTSVFSKAASVRYNAGGIRDPLLWLFLFLMMANCGVYALAWQKVIRSFDLNVAYANRTVYLLWAQIWAVLIFREQLCASNIAGLLLVIAGVLVVVFHE